MQTNHGFLAVSLHGRLCVNGGSPIIRCQGGTLRLDVCQHRPSPFGTDNLDLTLFSQGLILKTDSADKPLFLRAPVWWAVDVIRATQVTSYFANVVSISCVIA